MKSRALYHLLMTSAQSARLLVPSHLADRINAIAETVSIDRHERDGYTLTWTENGVQSQTTVERARFAFYVRGDVSALVARRPATLDVRQENWAEAHRLWGELVGDTELSQLAAPPLRAIPTTRDKPVRVTPAESGALLAGAAGLLGARSGLPALTYAIGLGLVAFGLIRRQSRVRLPSIAAAVAAIAAATSASAVLGGAADASGLRSTLASAALLLAVTALAPASRLGVRAVLPTGLACAAIGVAAANARPVFLVAGGSLVLADGMTLLLRSDVTRLRRFAAPLTVAVGCGTAARSLVSPAAAGVRDASDGIVLALAAAVFVGAVVGATHLSWDRASPWLAPAVTSVAALAVSGSRALLSLLLAMLAGQVAIAAVSAVRVRMQTSPAARATATPALGGDAGPQGTRTTDAAPHMARRPD